MGWWKTEEITVERGTAVGEAAGAEGHSMGLADHWDGNQRDERACGT